MPSPGGWRKIRAIEQNVGRSVHFPDLQVSGCGVLPALAPRGANRYQESVAWHPKIVGRSSFGPNKTGPHQITTHTPAYITESNLQLVI